MKKMVIKSLQIIPHWLYYYCKAKAAVQQETENERL